MHERTGFIDTFIDGSNRLYLPHPLLELINGELTGVAREDRYGRYLAVYRSKGAVPEEQRKATFSLPAKNRLVTIDEKVREASGLGNECTLMQAADHVEIWSRTCSR